MRDSQESDVRHTRVEQLVTDGGAPDPDEFQIPTIEELDAMRVACNLPQAELSRRAGFEDSRFNDILHQDLDPQTKTMRSLLDVLQEAGTDEPEDRSDVRGPKPKASPAVESGEDETGGIDRSGLYDKYEVYKDDDPVLNCFVLEPESDSAAREALIRYSEATNDENLADDLREWVTDLCTRGDGDE